jgi:hypothetical protein
MHNFVEQDRLVSELFTISSAILAAPTRQKSVYGFAVSARRR